MVGMKEAWMKANLIWILDSRVYFILELKIIDD
jgi:hypothetical protein